MNGCDILQKQNDPRWASVKLGTSNSSIGGWGCLLTCYSMLFTWALRREITPDAMNQVMRVAGKFSYGNLLWVPSASKGLYDNCVTWKARSVEESKPLSQASYDQLRDWLRANDNNFAILKLDFKPETPTACDTHFAVAWGVNAAGRLLVNDPAFGVCRTLAEPGTWSYYGRTRPTNYYGADDMSAIWRYDLITAIPQ